jgi:hypothetical protein
MPADPLRLSDKRTHYRVPDNTEKNDEHEQESRAEPEVSVRAGRALQLRYELRLQGVRVRQAVR